MNSRHCFLLLLSLGLVVALPASPVQAQTRIGEAAVVKNEVVRVAGPSSTQINVGDGLLRDEVVRTGLDSAARLVMADSTNLSLGPSATIKLDRTVFNDEHSYREIAIRMTSGAFRFVTGHSEKAAYKITTPLATIGVRGTILDVLSQRGRTTVVLQEGASSVCTVNLHLNPAHPAGRHRDHHLDRRQDHDPEDQQLAMDVRRHLCCGGRAVLGDRLRGCVACRDPAGR
jgi:hypothetical protein